MPPQPVDERFGVGEQASNAAPPPVRIEVVGILRRRQLDETSERPGRSRGKARIAARIAAFLPGIVAVETQDRGGRAATAARAAPRSARCRAAPLLRRCRRGPERSRPYSLRRRSSAWLCGWPARHGRGCRACGPCRTEACPGRIQIFGLAGAEDPPAKGDHPPARIADREHQPAAEAVVGLLAPSSGSISRPASTSLSSPNCFERALERRRSSGARPKPKRCAVAGVDAAALRDSRAPRRLRDRPAARRTMRRRRHHLGQRRRALGLSLRPRIRGGHLHARPCRPAPSPHP